MENELQAVLLEILNSTVAAKDFLVSEIPEVVNQLLLWRAIESGGCFILGVVLLWSIPIIFEKLKTAELKAYKNQPVIFAHIVSGFLVVPALFITNFDWLQILIAPKLYLAEYAITLMK